MERGTPFDTTKSVVDFAKHRGLPIATQVDERGKVKEMAWKSLQLPLYCAMLEANDDPRFTAARAAKRSACYCILGKTAEETGFTEAMASDSWQTDAERLVRQLLSEIRRGVFWPPSPADKWQYDYAGILYDLPEFSVNLDWLADQRKRGARA